MVTRSVPEVFSWARALIAPALHAALKTLPEAIWPAVLYHFSWQGADGTPENGFTGEIFRPALTLLAAEAAGGDPAEAVPAAVAVELAHNFSLLHNDVTDHRATRRHRAAAWTLFGSGPAILAGDALLALALGVLSEMPDARHPLIDAVLAGIDGHARDLSFEDRFDVTRAECLDMMSLKTGALVACACGLGAAAGGGDQGCVARLELFGAHVGLARQLADDVLGIWGEPDDTGRPRHADLVAHKRSAPVVAVLDSPQPAGADLLALLARGSLSAADHERAAGLVERGGGRKWTQELAARHLSAALTELDTAAAGRAVEELALLARFAAAGAAPPD
ncbi:polyprenyl synthetase family protein [Amycolatopsis sp. NPDC088138]|uniref:polyprenyl synthetase family protein n=1 Tax=Amycolatopsis sp. NPDC088138 TaxID=3363938 RepID=UPI00380EBFF4